MTGQGKNIIVFHQQNDFVNRLKFHMPNTMIIVEKRKMRLLIQAVRMNPVLCIVLHAEHDIPERPVFERFKKQFPRIPCIAVVGSQNMELARYCGTVGVECVLPEKELGRIGDEIVRVCTEKNNKTNLLEIGIDKTNQNYTSMIKGVLDMMEQNYREILNTNEIADWLEVSECTVSREFSSAGLPGPKKILMDLKAQYAIKLMYNKGLNIREIAALSGFTGEKRMAEYFHRTFGLPPGKYRQRKINKLNYK
jgi:AraC-like DNA-binding protein